MKLSVTVEILLLMKVHPKQHYHVNPSWQYVDWMMLCLRRYMNFNLFGRVELWEIIGVDGIELSCKLLANETKVLFNNGVDKIIVLFKLRTNETSYWSRRMLVKCDLISNCLRLSCFVISVKLNLSIQLFPCCDSPSQIIN